MTDPNGVKINLLGSLWRFFASIRLTVVVLLSLATLSIIGTLIPQNQSPADYFRIFGPFLYQLMSTLDIFDMYHAWWFQCLILILTVNIIVCSIDRLSNTWSIIFVRSPQFNLDGFRRRKSRCEFRRNGDYNALAPAIRKHVAASFGRGNEVAVDAGFAITAERGRWTRLGVYVVHLSVVVLLVGSLVGSRYGFEGYANIIEGKRINTLHLRDSVHTVTLPFSIQCDEFEVTFYKGGRRPKEFRSSLSIIGENGRTLRRKDIRVNDPLRYRGINIFQSSYGETGASKARVDPSQPLRSELELNFRSAASGMIYSHTTAMGKTIDLPEGLGSFKLDRYEPAAEFKGMALGPSLVGTLTPKDGPPETILLPLNHPGFDGMRRGTVIISMANIVPTMKPQYYTGLLVTKDPGVGLVYLGFVLMIAGCAVTFFMSHKRLVVEVQPVSGGVNVMVSGTANKNKIGFKQKIRELAGQLEKITVKS